MNKFKHKSIKKLSVRKRSLLKDAQLSARKRSIIERSGKAEQLPITVLKIPDLDVCPFDKKPCLYGKEYISSCDDVMVLYYPIFDAEGLDHCSRALGITFTE